MSGNRSLLHVDMDAFYAAVEQHDNPGLAGQPVVVGGAGGRGVVAAASYEVRRFGVHSAMPMREALRRCPQAVVIAPRFKRYREISSQVFEVFREFTDLVEGLSLDEAFLDVTGSTGLFGSGEEMAREIKKRIRERTGLTASVGVSHNKLLAKLASEMHKPDGLTVISPERVEQFLQCLPVDALWGVGPVTAAKLRKLGIERVVDIREVDARRLHDELGSLADWLRRLSYGDDPRPVVAHRAAKSASSETTYAHDLQDLEAIKAELARLARETAEWLEKKRLAGRTVTIKVRYSDFTTVTRSHTLSRPTCDPDVISSWAAELVHRTQAGRRPVRLLGARVNGLVEDAFLHL